LVCGTKKNLAILLAAFIQSHPGVSLAAETKGAVTEEGGCYDGPGIDENMQLGILDEKMKELIKIR
jgi:hypothetical protein